MREPILIENQRDDAARDGGRHAAAAQAEFCVGATGTAAELLGQAREWRDVGYERQTRCDHIGFRKRVVPRRPARTERGHTIVGSGFAILRARRTHGDDRGCIPRRGQPGITRRTSVRALAVVAGRSDNHDAGGRGPLHGLHQGVGCCRLVNRMPKRKIDDVDGRQLTLRIQALGEDEFDGRNDVARVALTGPIQHLEPDQVRLGIRP